MENLNALIEAMQTIAFEAIPYDKKLWNTRLIATYLGYSDTQVRTRIITLPDFPRPLKIGTGRWKAQEVIDWAESQGQKAGRKRKHE